MGELNSGFSRLDAALILATDNQKSVFRAAYDSLPDDRRNQCVVLAHEASQKPAGLEYVFADGTVIMVYSHTDGIVAVRTRNQSVQNRIETVNQVPYFTVAHPRKDELPEDTPFGFNMLLEIGCDLERRLGLEPRTFRAQRFTEDGMSQFAFLGNSIPEHPLNGAYICDAPAQASTRYRFLPANGVYREVHAVKTQSPNGLNLTVFTRGLLEPF